MKIKQVLALAVGSVGAKKNAGIIEIEHRLGFGGMFGALPTPPGSFQVFTAADDKPEAKAAEVLPVDQPNEISDEEDEGGYEGYFEGFDYKEYIKTDSAVAAVAAALQFSDFQRGSAAFGDINNGPDSPGVAQATIERVEVLMQMIMFLQMDPSFEKFSRYGCWCFPDGENKILGGYGDTKDEADKVCRRYHACQKCINMDHNDCPRWAGYKYAGRKNKKTGEKSIECNNDEETREGKCRKHHCECDKKLAMDLANHEMMWDPKYHQLNGGFDRHSECKIREERTIKTTQDNEQECCGQYPDRFSYVSKNNLNGDRRKCCVSKTYDPKVLACCHDGDLRQAGACMTQDEYLESLQN